MFFFTVGDVGAEISRRMTAEEFFDESIAEWGRLKGKHFVIYYGPPQDRTIALKLLHRAEKYYRSIGAQIGYTRYSRFWTWDNRVKIIMFPDQQSFVVNTGRPDWAKGYVDRDAHLFQSRTIVTYKQEHEFFDGVLPHEISHLVLHDFITSPSFPAIITENNPVQHRAISLWFDEGVAQLQEREKSAIADQMMRILMKRGQYIDFHYLSQWDIRKERDVFKIKVFYAQSLSVIEFLIKTYGSAAFGRLCRNLKDGKTFEEALRHAYTNRIDTLSDLEEKWVRYMSR